MNRKLLIGILLQVVLPWLQSAEPAARAAKTGIRMSRQAWKQAYADAPKTRLSFVPKNSRVVQQKPFTSWSQRFQNSLARSTNEVKNIYNNVNHWSTDYIKKLFPKNFTTATFWRNVKDVTWNGLNTFGSMKDTFFMKQPIRKIHEKIANSVINGAKIIEFEKKSYLDGFNSASTNRRKLQIVYDSAFKVRSVIDLYNNEFEKYPYDKAIRAYLIACKQQGNKFLQELAKEATDLNKKLELEEGEKPKSMDVFKTEKAADIEKFKNKLFKKPYEDVLDGVMKGLEKLESEKKHYGERMKICEDEPRKKLKILFSTIEDVQGSLKFEEKESARHGYSSRQINFRAKTYIGEASVWLSELKSDLPKLINEMNKKIVQEISEKRNEIEKDKRYYFAEPSWRIQDEIQQVAEKITRYQEDLKKYPANSSEYLEAYASLKPLGELKSELESMYRYEKNKREEERRKKEQEEAKRRAEQKAQEEARRKQQEQESKKQQNKEKESRYSNNDSSQKSYSGTMFSADQLLEHMLKNPLNYILAEDIKISDIYDLQNAIFKRISKNTAIPFADQKRILSQFLNDRMVLFKLHPDRIGGKGDQMKVFNALKNSKI